MAVPIDFCGGDRIRGSSWQFLILVLGGESQGFHGRPIRWLWGGEVVVLMAVPDTG